jgi:hypothetical protein
MTERLSHMAYSLACARLSLETGRAVALHVQVRKRGEVLCGQVLECFEFAAAGEWFKVQTDLGPLAVESRNVRLCSGDGRCRCEGQA